MDVIDSIVTDERDSMNQPHPPITLGVNTVTISKDEPIALGYLPKK